MLGGRIHKPPCATTPESLSVLALATLVVDNHDSFTFNLVQLLAAGSGEMPIVVANDAATWADVAGRVDRVVISPGPGRPERARDMGLSREVLAAAEVPVLGVCLGHQGIAHACGGRIVHAPEPVHGRRSRIFHDGSALFEGIPQGFWAVRYHSLVVAREGLPQELEVAAWTDEGLVMALRHRRRPRWGVQFHPESVMTEHGARLVENFLGLSA